MWIELLSSYTVRVVLIGTILLGVVSGMMGVFLNLRKQALVGDALSHSALPGVVLAYIITQEATLFVSIVGAIVAAAVAILLMDVIRKYSKIKNDAILALVLSSLFGLGQVLLSVIRDTAGQNQARLNTFIFGQAATMSTQDITFLMVILSVVLITIILLWRHIKLFIFNKDFYQSLGFSSSAINFALNILTIFVVVSGIQTVGVILMSALLIAPGVSARLWSDRLSINVLLAATFGGLSGLLGTLFGIDMATGPVIVIFATSIVILSLLFAPRKGVIWKKISEVIHQNQIKKYHVLIHIFAGKYGVDFDTDSVSHLIEEDYLLLEDNQYELTLKGRQKVFSIMRGESK